MDTEDEAQTLVSFDGDYADPREAADLERERPAAGRQARSLGEHVDPDGVLESYLEQLNSRRSSNSGDDVEQFDVVRRDAGFPVLVARGEILVRRDALERSAAMDVLADNHFMERSRTTDCPEIGALVARFVPAEGQEVPPEALAALAVELRSRGVPVSLNHMAPLAAIIKGRGGAEPSAPARAAVEAGTRRSAGPRTVVAVVDTGVAEEVRSDGWLRHDVVERRPDNVDEIDVYGADGCLDLASGHGTFVSGVVQQVAPGAELRVYRAVDSDGIGSEMRVACAMVRAVREGADILNLSLGTQTLDDGIPIALEAALDIIGGIGRREGREVLVIAAAGNYGDTRPCWPAAFRQVVAVAAVSADLAPADTWSSHGVWVDCSAVGEGITSTYLPGTETWLIDPRPDTFGENSWAMWSGTSFAAPQIAGAVARLCDERSLTPRQALTILLRSGTYRPNFGRVVRVLPGT